MRLPVPLLLFLSAGLSGCVLTDGDAPIDCSVYEDGPTAYRYRYAGDDVAVAGGTYGWAVLFTNPYDEAIQYRAEPLDAPGAEYGYMDRLSGLGLTKGLDWLAPGESSLWIFSTQVPAGAGKTDLTYGYHVQTSMWTYDENRSEWDLDGGFCEIESGRSSTWDVRYENDRPAVVPGDKVQTLTVGLWTNGTSFYTNIQDLDDDPAFPAGYDRTGFDGTPLPVYVYARDRSEQPVGNRDRCWFTTIFGYNELLKTQRELGTNIRYLMPEEGYTVEGNEDHSLYGEPLIFLNTVVAHEGTTTDSDEAPDPAGECFDHRNPCRKLGTLSDECMATVPDELPPSEP